MRRNKHNLSHTHLTAFNLGEIIPIACVEVLPGDTFRHATSVLLRMAPMQKPLMHPVHVQVHHWYVPNRIIWSGWEDFITGKVEEATTPLPTVTLSATAGDNDLTDYLGIDPASGTIEVNALPVYAYNKIYNEFYRDQDLISEVTLSDNNVLTAAWEKDYFTTARTELQQGSAVEIPFGSTGSADIKYGANIAGTDREGKWYVASTTSGGVSEHNYGDAAGQDDGSQGNTTDHNLIADLSTATGVMTIADWRNAMALQRFAEARARFGERYVDYLRYLGVNPRDGRLDRPEYLGGGRQTVAFSEVLATSDVDSIHDVGDMYGHGIGALRTRPYRKFFEEHGHVLSLAVVRPEAIYTEALDRNWLRTQKEDYWQIEQEVLGSQAVTKGEVYSSHGNFTDLFGYVDRHLEYRMQHNRVSGVFRDSTDYDWHLGRILGTSPTLNQSFIECNPSNRVFQDTSMPQVLMQSRHMIAARRMVAKRARTN